jgi:hypothetical protein
MRWWVIVGCAGCASAASGPSRFPSAEALRKLEDAPVVERWRGGTERAVESWTLESAPPARVDGAASSWSGAWDQLLAQKAEERRGLVRPTEAMRCAAREIGRFYLSQRALPSRSLSRFMAARCGNPTAEVLTAWVEGAIPDGASDSDVFARWRENVERQLDGQQRIGQAVVGIWFGRENGRGVVMLTAAPRRVELEPASLVPGDDGRVVLRGELLVPGAHIEAIVNQGAHGYARCLTDERLRAPRFAVSCPVERSDESAWLEVAAFAPGRITGPLVVDLLVWPAGAPRTDWRRPRAPAATGGGDPATQLLSMLNEVRREAALAPLELTPAESAVAARVAPHYFAAVLGSEPETVADQVVLGVRAGWDVEVPVRFGYFTAGAVYAGDAAELLAAMLERPSGREALFAPDARKLAVGTFTVEDRQVLAGVLSTYELTDDREADARRVAERLGRLRREAGRSPPAVIRSLEAVAEAHVRTVQRGSSPREAMEALMQAVAERTQLPVRAWAVDYSSVETMQFPAELLSATAVQMVVGVAPYKPAGEPWTRYLAVFVTIEGTMAQR